MDWNERYAQGDTPWEKGAAAPPLEEISARLGDEVWGEGPVLVPGCGFGHDARWIARKNVIVEGLDVSELALQGAREQSEGDNPSFELGDFFEAEAGEYSAIFEHTCFCAISPFKRARVCFLGDEVVEEGRASGRRLLFKARPRERSSLRMHDRGVGWPL